MNETLLRQLSNLELLRYVDRSNPEVLELAQRLEELMNHEPSPLEEPSDAN